MKKKIVANAICSVSLLSLTMTAQAAVDSEKRIVDINNNLYYTGLQGSGNSASNTLEAYVPRAGYPAVAVPYGYADSPLFSCLRDVPDSSPDNTALDPRRSCYGAAPEVIELSTLGVSAGDTLHLGVAGILDPDTLNDYSLPGISGVPPVDARGELGSISAYNGLNNYSLIGIWANTVSGNSSNGYLDGYLESLTLVDDDVNDDGFIDRMDVYNLNIGFTQVGDEFMVTDAFNMSPLSTTIVDFDGNNVADLGTAYQLQGQMTVPAGATHLLLAYNGHKGGFYHHGDPGYVGSSNPRWGALTAQERADAGLLENVVATADTFQGDQGFNGETGDYAAGHPRAVGVFMVTASADASSQQPDLLIEAPTASFNYTADGATVTFDASSSVANNSNTIIQYIWSFGDGETLTTTQSSTVYTYSSTNYQSYPVPLKVIDSYSVSAQTLTHITAGVQSGGSTGGTSGGGGGGAWGPMALLLPLIGFGLRRRHSKVKAR